MEEEINEIETLVTRHRREKRELQAKVQSLKKALKGDKTKKKEITTEISRLENELELKQKKELEISCYDDIEDDEGGNKETIPSDLARLGFSVNSLEIGSNIKSEYSKSAEINVNVNRDEKSIDINSKAAKGSHIDNKDVKESSDLNNVTAASDNLTNQDVSVSHTELNDDITSQITLNEKVDLVSKTKTSKAQKRRDKKAQEDKERAERIKAQEIANLNGPRNLEAQTIKAKLKEKKLSIFSIPSDGDCLFKAISHQLEKTGRPSFSVAQLRNMTAKHIRDNKDDFLPFMTDPETYEMMSDEQFEDYCNKISNTKLWGGQLEIKALSSKIKCPIDVIQATGPDTIKQGDEFEGPALVLTYHRHMYSLGEHYNSTQTEPEDSGQNG